jgi:hypothetical protein
MTSQQQIAILSQILSLREIPQHPEDLRAVLARVAKLKTPLTPERFTVACCHYVAITLELGDMQDFRDLLEECEGLNLRRISLLAS